MKPGRKPGPLTTPSKGRTGRNFNIYIRDTRVLEVFELLRHKWFNEGLADGSNIGTFTYLVTNFGEISKRTPDNGSLPLDANRRKKLALMSDVFRIVGRTEGKSDLEVIAVAIDYLYEIFRKEDFLDHFIKAKGELKHG